MLTEHNILIWLVQKLEEERALAKHLRPMSFKQLQAIFWALPARWSWSRRNPNQPRPRPSRESDATHAVSELRAPEEGDNPTGTGISLSLPRVGHGRWIVGND